MSNAEAGDFKCKRSTISSCVKRVSGHSQPTHLLVCCNEFLICPPEKSKWQNWISKSVFAMFYYSRMCWASFRCPLAFFCFCLCHGEAVEFIISCSTSTVWVCLSFSNFPPNQGHLFVLLALFTSRCCSLLHSCTAFVFLITLYCAYNARFVPSGKAHLSWGYWDHNDWLLSPRLEIKIKYIFVSTSNLKQ